MPKSLWRSQGGGQLLRLHWHESNQDGMEHGHSHGRLTCNLLIDDLVDIASGKIREFGLYLGAVGVFHHVAAAPGATVLVVLDFLGVIVGTDPAGAS